MRRVMKSEIKPDTFTKPDGLAVCLECWKKWMAGDERDLSASRMKLGGGIDEERDEWGNVVKVAYEVNPYDEQYKADLKIGQATGVMIDGLKPCWRWAIYRKCSIATQWKFPLLDFMQVIEEAEADLEKRLRKNIATGTQFQ